MTWRATIAREAELRRFHESFAWRSLAVSRAVDDMIAAWRTNPPPRNGPAPRLNDGEDYELERFPGETRRDGMRSPGT
jgi:hypothetical protein